ncbi:hypothetical protein AK812_SmicGene41413 [Symbiodinium microadriaticum]|uniref:Uncharacterized protein n=1 Tax=Symbiodinium microadriaticum TaxID=2951 RepID=A0A1Q9C681_SYMMI|nr:hypothetical protein AK812_SmicGene41413 [Symbiodinium microadriaticum]
MEALLFAEAEGFCPEGRPPPWPPAHERAGDRVPGRWLAHPIDPASRIPFLHTIRGGATIVPPGHEFVGRGFLDCRQVPVEALARWYCEWLVEIAIVSGQACDGSWKLGGNVLRRKPALEGEDARTVARHPVDASEQQQSRDKKTRMTNEAVTGLRVQAVDRTFNFPHSTICNALKIVDQDLNLRGGSSWAETNALRLSAAFRVTPVLRRVRGKTAEQVAEQGVKKEIQPHVKIEKEDDKFPIVAGDVPRQTKKKGGRVKIEKDGKKENKVYKRRVETDVKRRCANRLEGWETKLHYSQCDGGVYKSVLAIDNTGSDVQWRPRLATDEAAQAYKKDSATGASEDFGVASPPNSEDDYTEKTERSGPGDRLPMARDVPTFENLAERLKDYFGAEEPPSGSMLPSTRQLRYVLYIWRHWNVSGRHHLVWGEVSTRTETSRWMENWRKA